LSPQRVCDRDFRFGGRVEAKQERTHGQPRGVDVVELESPAAQQVLASDEDPGAGGGAEV